MIYNEEYHNKLIEDFRNKLSASSPLDICQDFVHIIYDYYDTNRRDFPWRRTEDPYHIFVSEVMLQQTQTDRVVSKYESFLTAFPTVESLADAGVQDVLEQWQGLGYNRRALYLHKSAQLIVAKYEGQIPTEPDELVQLPGIGEATANSIAAFGFNKAVVFIETNIRTVYIYFFFRNSSDPVSDKQILPLLNASLDRDNPREWYSALMDYGVMIKKNRRDVGRKSKHYVRQKPFRGSNREIRGAVLKLLLSKTALTKSEILDKLSVKTNEKRLKHIIEQLIDEGFIHEKNTLFMILEKEEDDGTENTV